MGLAPGTLVTAFNPTAGSSSSTQVRSFLAIFVYAVTTDAAMAQVLPSKQQQQLAADNLYRDANSMLYGDNKPSEEDIDRVVGKINQECVFSFVSSHTQWPDLLTCCSIDKKGKFSRKRLNEDEGDITYINERNRVFNKKVRLLLTYVILFIGRDIDDVFHADCTVLRQIHVGDPSELRAGDRTLIMFVLPDPVPSYPIPCICMMLNN